MKLGQQIPWKSSQHGKESVKTKKSKQNKGSMAIKPQELNDTNNKQLESSKKEKEESFNDHMYILQVQQVPEYLSCGIPTSKVKL